LIVFNYLCGIKLSRDHREGRSTPMALALGLGVNLAVLAYYKYTNFFIDNANTIFGTHFVLHKIILPLGISFFIFQKIAYLVDAYRGEAEEYNFLDFSLFVMYFPQLIAGPIVHHKEMIPQFRKASIFRLCPEDLAGGLTLFTIGLIKKVVIADTVTRWSDPIFAAAQSGTSPTMIDAWCAALSFTFQIYFDFSGYTDMALGLALMIGIRLPLNFNSPYKAVNIIEFWRRWHMTLSRFLRDYVYIPLGGNRRGPRRRYINLLATMLIGGLWHGAAWTFVAWGGLHGFYLVLNHGWHSLRQRLEWKPRVGAGGLWPGRLLTFGVVVLTWVFFRAESFHAARVILEGMAGLNGIALPTNYSAYFGPAAPMLQHAGVKFDDALVPHWGGLWQSLAFVGLLLVIWFAPNAQELLARLKPSLSSLQPARLNGGLRRACCALGLVGPDGSFTLSPATGSVVGVALLASMVYQAMRATALQPFIYFQF
jgi:alginate O-acetyltransferase complex protein AlgI